MPHDSRNVSEANPKEALGSLGACLVEGDPEQRSRERRVRRRSLVISILTQATVVALLMLLPLLGKTERIAMAITTAIPPYGHPPRRSPGPIKRTTGRAPLSPVALTFFSPLAPPVNHTSSGDNSDGPPPIGPGGNDLGSGPACSGCLNIGGPSSGPRPPQPPVEKAAKPTVIHKTSIDPAMLIRRIDPVYPPLAKQIHKEGRVEMRARISTEGSIESLEILSGDPIFYQSAKDAVTQWLYRPTVLNGQKVEVDTYISVIYTMRN